MRAAAIFKLPVGQQHPGAFQLLIDVDGGRFGFSDRFRQLQNGAGCRFGSRGDLQQGGDHQAHLRILVKFFGDCRKGVAGGHHVGNMTFSVDAIF